MMTDELNDLAQRLRALSRHEHDDLSIGDEAAEAIRALIEQRDAAFAMSGCECGADEACAQLVALHAEIERLRACEADARRYQHLRDRCGYHAPMEPHQPAEWSIWWEFQQRTPEEQHGSFDYLIDRDIDAAQQEQTNDR